MITGFSKETGALSPDELKLSEIILNRFKTKYNDKKFAVKQAEIIKRMREKKFDITGPRLRKIFNYLRSNGNPIIATSSGCYYSNDIDEILMQVESLRDRQRALDGPISGLEKLLNQI